jgi:hypothetical protein
VIGRLLRSTGTLLACFAVATLLAEAIIVGYLAMRWQLSREKLVQMLAIAQGIDLFAAHEEAIANQEEVPPEQPAYDDWLERRATMFRDLELREQALENALAMHKVERSRLAADERSFQQAQETFEARLAEAKAQAQSEGMETLTSILQSIKPDQAKDQILEMLDNDEMEKVVVLLNGMMGSKRAKIIAEFETEAENEKVSEILRLIGEGEPVASMADKTMGQLQPNTPQGT